MNENAIATSALAVWASQASYVSAAKDMADKLQCPLLSLTADKSEHETFDFLLQVNDEGVSLLQGKSVIQVDFVAGANLHRRLHGGGRGQPIAKAIGLKAGNIVPSVMDCTAGLARDAFVLASLGCTVQLCERSPVVHLLLQDGLLRAGRSADADVQKIAARMALHACDAITVLEGFQSSDKPDVIYLDPMFPERRKKSAAVKKDMAAFHALVGADDDADALLPLALQHARCRVVVKRPRHAPHLGNQKPGLILEGESTRFDVYPLSSMALAR